MNKSEVEEFRFDYGQILCLRTKLKDNKLFIKRLHSWEKNGSHDDAILKAVDQREILKDQYEAKLKGMEFEEWKSKNKLLTSYLGKLRRAKQVKIEMEKKIREL